MKNQIIFLMLTLSVFLSSCKPTLFYQVYETVPKNLKSESKTLVFENEQCSISYNLWSNEGDPGFVFFNKTNELIHVHLDESFFVINGTAYDYFQNRIFSSSSATSTQSTKTNSVTQWGGWLTALNVQQQSSVAFNNQKGITEVESRTITIPPKTSKSISEFKVNNVVFRSCDLLLFPTTKQIKSITYNEGTTPLQFYNLISYKVGQATAPQIVRHDFYVSSVTNYSENEFYRYEVDEFCGKKSQNKKRYFSHNAPDKFYLEYTRNPGESRKN